MLDTYNLATSRLILVVVGPDKQTVGIGRSVMVSNPREALPIDYPQIEPGNPFLPLWAAVAPIKFPGNFNSLVNVSLYQPGDYKVQVVYNRPAGVQGGPHGVWQGATVSNTLVFHVVGPPPPPEKANPNTPPETAPSATPTPAPTPTPQPPAPPPGSSY